MLKWLSSVLITRLVREPELAELAEWEAQNTTGAGWGLDQITEEYLLQSSQIWVAEDAGDLLGYAVVRAFPDGFELFNILVPSHARRRGVGTALMQAIHEHALGQAVWLEVRAGNESAQQFYMGLGYEQIGLRARYYRDGEDAILMSRELALD